MKEKMLILTYRSPLPLNSGGRIRMFQDIRILAEQYDIDLLFIDDNHPGSENNELEKYCTNIYPFRIHKLHQYFYAVKAFLFHRQPAQVGYFYHKKIKNWLNQNIRTYNKVFCIHIRMSNYVADYTDIYKIIDCVDAMTLNYYNRIGKTKGVFKLINALEYKRLKTYEANMYDKFDKTIVISERDSNYLQYELKIKHIPSVIPLYSRNLGDQDTNYNSDILSIAFIGKMDYEPNISAVQYFLEDIYPLIKKAYPLLIFNIIGGSPTKKVKKWENIKGVNVLGFVENPVPILQNARFIIAPMISGSGLQTKIIESMSLEKLVITTPIGADGISGLNGNEIIITNNTEEMISQCLYYLEDIHKPEVKTIGLNAKIFIYNNYRYNIIKSKLLTAISLESKRRI